MARCAVRAAFSGARLRVIRTLCEHSFSPLTAGWAAQRAVPARDE
jgi:hypothetical protein